MSLVDPVDLSSVFPKPEPVRQYVDILTNRGIEWGLIGPREIERVWDRHIYNSVSIVGLVPVGAQLADIGSGAGLPGIPVALARPDLVVSLVEPLLRRATFLTDVVAELGLGDRVRVVRRRAEDLDETYDVVTARALAPLPRLLTWCADLVRPGGRILALKGRTAAGEVEESAPQLRRLGLSAEVVTVRASATAEATSVVRVVFPAR